MLVPVMLVGPVGMGMGKRLVLMGMTMPEGGRFPFMHMRMMFVIVPVPMLMLQFFVRVLMRMTIFQKEEGERDHKQNGGRNLKKRDGLPKSRRR